MPTVIFPTAGGPKTRTSVGWAARATEVMGVAPYRMEATDGLEVSVTPARASVCSTYRSFNGSIERSSINECVATDSWIGPSHRRHRAWPWQDPRLTAEAELGAVEVRTAEAWQLCDTHGALAAG